LGSDLSITLNGITIVDGGPEKKNKKKHKEEEWMGMSSTYDIDLNEWNENNDWLK